LVTAWDTNLFSLVRVVPSRHTLSLDLSSANDGSIFRFSNVYALCERVDKPLFLENLATHDPGDNTPWMIAGDFNLTRDPGDRNNANFSVTEAELFNETINNLGLIELPLRDRCFTWSNGRTSPTLIRLDRVFINHAWNECFPSSSLASISRDTSDHVALLASISTRIPRGGYFRYEPAWAIHERFRTSIVTAWSSTYRSDPTAKVVARLRLCRSSCKRWQRRTPPRAQREKDCRLLINLLDLLEEGRPLPRLNGACVR
jgi:hypothetical protein